MDYIASFTTLSASPEGCEKPTSDYPHRCCAPAGKVEKRESGYMDTHADSVRKPTAGRDSP